MAPAASGSSTDPSSASSSPTTACEPYSSPTVAPFRAPPSSSDPRCPRTPTDPAPALGCELVAGGLVRVDAEGRTSVPGVWAAGNAANPRAQVITAAGEGSAVAIAINTELVANDLDRAVRRAAAANAA